MIVWHSKCVTLPIILLRQCIYIYIVSFGLPLIIQLWATHYSSSVQLGNPKWPLQYWKHSGLELLYRLRWEHLFYAWNVHTSVWKSVNFADWLSKHASRLCSCCISTRFLSAGGSAPSIYWAWICSHNSINGGEKKKKVSFQQIWNKTFFPPFPLLKRRGPAVLSGGPFESLSRRTGWNASAKQWLMFKEKIMEIQCRDHTR